MWWDILLLLSQQLSKLETKDSGNFFPRHGVYILNAYTIWKMKDAVAQTWKMTSPILAIYIPEVFWIFPLRLKIFKWKFYAVVAWAYLTQHPNDISISSAIFVGLPIIDSSIVFTRLCQCALPYHTHASLGPPECTTQTAPWSVQPFLHRPQQTAQACPFPKNCAFTWGNLDPHLIHGSLGPPKSSTQMASRSVEPFCRRACPGMSLSYSDRPTDWVDWLVGV